MTTFGLSAECGRLIEYDSVADLRDLYSRGELGNAMPIGGGSNLLFTTGKYDGTVIHCRNNNFEIKPTDADNLIEVKAMAGCRLDSLCHYACQHGLWGLENLSGIPGEISGAAVQNVGAYGAEFQDIVASVEAFDQTTGQVVSLSREECCYGYRDSIFKRFRNKHIITSAILRLTSLSTPNLKYAALAQALNCNESGTPTPMTMREEVLRLRNSKLPDPAITGSAGSFFKNPVIAREQYGQLCRLKGIEIPGHMVDHSSANGSSATPGVKLSAAWLIDKAGCKDFTSGGAALWPTQPLVIVNANGNATGADVVALEKRIIDAVESSFGITLEPEVIHI